MLKPSKAYQPPSRSPPGGGFSLGGGGERFEIGRERIVADQTGAVLRAPCSHADGLDLSRCKEFIQR